MLLLDGGKSSNIFLFGCTTEHWPLETPTGTCYEAVWLVFYVLMFWEIFGFMWPSSWAPIWAGPATLLP